jgi:predicted PurR-regulated permease PerM
MAEQISTKEFSFNAASNQLIVIFFTCLIFYLIYLLGPILTPFLLGSLLAYLADPLVKRLEKAKVSHLLSVVIVFSIFILIIFLLVFMLIPLIQRQIVILIQVLPQVTDWIQNKAIPWMRDILEIDSSTVTSTLSTALPKTGWLVSTVLQSGYTVVLWGVNVVLTPVVMFYMLRDWDPILLRIKNVFPKSKRPTVIELTRECDEVLSGFFRGQLLVMVALSFIYGVGLTLVGLHVGLMVGIIGGMLSLIPYLGSMFVLVAASITMFVQYGDWHSLIWVFAVYMVGQVIEGYFLTPNLVGQRIGLHPVVVIFAIMAGGILFGFFGVLLALPVAAVIKVLLRFAYRRAQIK